MTDASGNPALEGLWEDGEGKNEKWARIAEGPNMLLSNIK